MYGVYNCLRLTGRDLVFFFRNCLRKLRYGNQGPIIICNSYPKSGTHLLYQILCTIPGFIRWPDIVSVQSLSGTMNYKRHIRWKLGSAPPRAMIPTHLMHTPEILEILDERPCIRFFIIRDLRDVAVSHARWVCKEPRIFLHRIYTEYMRTDEERLMASIQGLPPGTPFGSNISQPSIGQDFSRWLGWLDDPDTLVVRFEDLVGNRGGGSDEARIQSIIAIANHLDLELKPDDIARRFSPEALAPTSSLTFRKGTIGGWREDFSSDHKHAFKMTAGDLLIRLGYETTQDW